MKRMTGWDWTMLLGLSILWGGSFMFVGVIVGHLPPLTVVWLRVTMAAVVLWLILALRGTPMPRGREAWRVLAVMGLLNNAVPFTLLVTAQGELPSALASILNATTPLFTLLVAHFATRDERMSRTRVLGIGLGFAGVAVMMGGAALTAGTATVAAQVACLGAALSYGSSAVWGRRFAALPLAPPLIAFGMLASASVMLLPLALVVDAPLSLPVPPTRVVLALLALAVPSTALAYLLYFRLLGRAGAVNVSLVTFLVPVSAIVLGITVLGESLAPRHVAGLALIAAGLVAIDGRVSARFRRVRPSATP